MYRVDVFIDNKKTTTHTHGSLATAVASFGLTCVNCQSITETGNLHTKAVLVEHTSSTIIAVYISNGISLNDVLNIT